MKFIIPKFYNKSVVLIILGFAFLNLNLTGQEDYTNPFTGETERGTNQWNHRWENDRGDVIYSENQGYSPNDDVNITVKGFKRSEIRKR